MSMTSASAPAEPLPDDAPHILVVDDDHKIRDLLTSYLVRQGFRITSASDTEQARSAMRGLAFDLVLLDVMLPGQSGLDFARELKTYSSVPICMLTAHTEPEERVAGLEIGIEDYVAKPFEPRELVLRLRNIMRRGAPVSLEAPPDEVRMGPYTFHVGRGELRRGEEGIKLTERERDLLRQFAKSRGQPIQRHELAADESTGSERAIDVQINRLRRKIEADPSNPVFLQTVRGKGYILYTD